MPHCAPHHDPCAPQFTSPRSTVPHCAPHPEPWRLFVLPAMGPPGARWMYGRHRLAPTATSILMQSGGGRILKTGAAPRGSACYGITSIRHSVWNTSCPAAACNSGIWLLPLLLHIESKQTEINIHRQLLGSYVDSNTKFRHKSVSSFGGICSFPCVLLFTLCTGLLLEVSESNL